MERVKVQASNFAHGLKVRDQILNKKCKTGQNESWPRSRATSRSRDLLNKQATEALRNDKMTSNTVTECGLGLLTSWTKKGKINFNK